MIRYEYRVLDEVALIQLLTARARVAATTEGFVADDQIGREYDALLAAGFRWVRSSYSYGMAVFERETAGDR